MMPALAMASLPPLPGLAQLGPSRPAAAEVELFPAFKGAEDGDWQVQLQVLLESGSKDIRVPGLQRRRSSSPPFQVRRGRGLASWHGRASFALPFPRLERPDF